MTPPAGGTERKPSVRQIYALAAALCAWTGVEFPRTQADASELLEGIRHDIGHPQPRLEDVPRRRGRRYSRSRK